MKYSQSIFLLIFILLFTCYLDNFVYSDTLYTSTTINIDDLQKRNYSDFGDLLSCVPGISIRNIGAVGQWTSFRIWGSNNHQVSLLLDGRPLSDVWSGSNDLNTIPEEMIEQIEIYPTLNPFGINPIGGTINLVSKSVPSDSPFTKIVYRTGGDHYSDIDVMFSQRLTSKCEIVSGVLLKKYGELLADQKYVGQIIRSKISYGFSPNWKLQYTILNNKSDLDIPYVNIIPGDTLFLESPHRKRIRYDHTLETSFNLRKIQTQLRLEHTSLHYELRENFNPKKTFPIQTTGLYLHQQLERITLPFSWGIYTQRRELKDHQGQKLQDTITHGFIQGATHLGSHLALILQMHAHISSDKKCRFSLATQFSYRLFDALTFHSGYVEGIRDPSLGERFGFPFYPDIPVTENQLMVRNASSQILPNPALKPETSQSIEAGFRWKVTDTFITSWKGYLRSTKDLIEGTPIDGNYWFDNRSKATFRGIDTQIDIGPYYGFQANLTLNLLKATDIEEKNLLERPNLWGNGSVSWNRDFFQHDLNVHVSVSNHYWSGYWKLTGDTVEETNLISIDPSSLIHFKVTCTFMQRVQLSFAIDNIVGTDTFWVSDIPLMKKMTRLGISWEMFN